VSEIAADDENVGYAATLVGPIVEVIPTIANAQKKIEPRILETTVAPQKVKNSTIFSHRCQDTNETCAAEDTFSDAIVCDKSPICGPDRQMFRMEKVADIGDGLLSQKTHPLG
jgi:hypothetical protein